MPLVISLQHLKLTVLVTGWHLVFIILDASCEYPQKPSLHYMYINKPLNAVYINDILLLLPVLIQQNGTIYFRYHIMQSK